MCLLQKDGPGSCVMTGDARESRLAQYPGVGGRSGVSPVRQPLQAPGTIATPRKT
ncbi:hypothetical protein LMG29542_04511 [Paraburkholderia humisilvae]|uniref:Uncharacterized protein n=1 Tax=Paraburkholderia humisilvae TaxID=627669 RepID=A0A6J5E9E3_9BURK|nr:hypothetical protein LMG29542_04511 [Paraburkholderia humisilvae]